MGDLSEANFTALPPQRRFLSASGRGGRALCVRDGYALPTDLQRKARAHGDDLDDIGESAVLTTPPPRDRVGGDRPRRPRHRAGRQVRRPGRRRHCGCVDAAALAVARQREPSSFSEQQRLSATSPSGLALPPLSSDPRAATPRRTRTGCTPPTNWRPSTPRPSTGRRSLKNSTATTTERPALRMAQPMALPHPVRGSEPRLG